MFVNMFLFWLKVFTFSFEPPSTTCTQVDQYRTWAEDNNVLAFYSVSARSDSNVDMAIHTLLQHIVSAGLS